MTEQAPTPTPWRDLTSSARDSLVIAAITAPTGSAVVNAKLEALRLQMAARKAKAKAQAKSAKNGKRKGGRR